MLRIVVLTLLIALNTIAASSQPPVANAAKPIALGLSDKLHSAALGEDRAMNIYFPADYKQDGTVKYPVIYLLDGGMDEDFIHVTGIVQFDTFPWVARIPNSIVVGIVNVDRRRDFTFPTSIATEQKRNPTSGHSAKFIEFLRTELIPFVESKYHGNGSRTLIGESLGGLLATEILLRQPDLFSKYIIVSPSVWWDSGSLLAASPEALKRSQAKADVYIGVGKEGLTPTESPRVMEVDANQLADKLSRAGDANLTVKFDYLPAEDHATIGHQAVFNAFRLLYPAAKKD